MIEKMKKWMEDKKGELASFLQQLVQAPSLPGQEAQAQGIIIEKLKSLGAKVDCWEPGGDMLITHPLFCCPRTHFSGSPNVVGVWKGTGEGKSLILNGHIDVVPPGDLAQWDEDPFSGKIRQGKMYGRGVTDMKGGLVAMLYAVQCLQEMGVPLKGDVIFQSVIEEERGGAGTLAAFLRGYQGDGAIIPEPTDLKIFPKQQGSMWFRIGIKGKSAHGGTRYEGISAIEKSYLVMEAIGQLEEKRNARAPIPIPINVGTIEGGNWPSSVPDHVEITGRMGVAPSEDLVDAQQELNHAISSIEDEWLQENPPVLQWYGARWHPGNLPAHHPLEETLVQSFKEVLGKDPVIQASPWGTDGGLLNKAGGIPVLIFGPGKTGVAHYPNEHIELDQVGTCAVVIARMIMDWCNMQK